MEKQSIFFFHFSLYEQCGSEIPMESVMIDNTPMCEICMNGKPIEIILLVNSHDKIKHNLERVIEILGGTNFPSHPPPPFLPILSNS